MQLEIIRTHRMRDIAEYSAFGPGVFSDYDYRVFVYEDGDDLYIDTFDPLDAFPRRFVETSSDGVLTAEVTKSIKQARLLDSGGSPTGTFNDGETVEITGWNGYKFYFELWDDASGDKNGRLTKMEDRNGYGITLTYKSWTPSEITASPERQWQIDTVTDAYGRAATFTYKSTQESGRWVVEDIDLPNGETISYTYSSGKLSQVDHPDGSDSTFAYVTDSPTSTTIYRYDDPVADAPNEDVYLTGNFTSPPGDDQIYSTSSLMVRLVTNGEDEVTFLRFASDYTQINTYEGGGVMKETQTTTFASYFKTWSIEEEMGILFLSGTLESTASQVTGANLMETPTAIKDIQGRSYSLEYYE